MYVFELGEKASIADIAWNAFNVLLHIHSVGMSNTTRIFLLLVDTRLAERKKVPNTGPTYSRRRKMNSENVHGSICIRCRNTRHTSIERVLGCLWNNKWWSTDAQKLRWLRSASSTLVGFKVDRFPSCHGFFSRLSHFELANCYCWQLCTVCDTNGLSISFILV